MTRRTDFFLHIRPRTYGDDVVAGLSDEIIPIFNNVSYAAFCKKTYFMNFTSSDKTSDLKETLSLNEMSFLKRKFRYHKALKKYVACLDKDSIVKSLYFIQPSKAITIHLQLLETVVSALWELFFHIDNCDDFHSLRSQLISYMVQLTPFRHQEINDKLPTYEDLLSFFQ
jgi:hypothetical protein